MLFKIRKAIRSDKFEKCLFIFGLLFMFMVIIRIFYKPSYPEINYFYNIFYSYYHFNYVKLFRKNKKRSI